MNQGFNDNDSLPHKKAGKNQSKSSPNKKGCEKNNYQPHEFANFDTLYYLQSEGKYRVVSNHFVRCIDCGKSRSYKMRKPLDSPAIALVARFKGGEYWEVELNKAQTRLRQIAKMDW